MQKALDASSLSAAFIAVCVVEPLERNVNTQPEEDADIERECTAPDYGPGRINTFYTTRVGLTLEFQYQDFYAGIRRAASSLT
jgi:hypothetical protein